MQSFHHIQRGLMGLHVGLGLPEFISSSIYRINI